ncbi:hypothetical protein TNCV_923741 [Trichonephila clavipes]|nr:hypothetical protein TNCV_923741 [Trichonephila clavipes]
MEWRDRNGNDDSLTGYLSVSSYCKGVCQRYKVDVDVKRNVLPGDVVGPIKRELVLMFITSWTKLRCPFSAIQTKLLSWRILFIRIRQFTLGYQLNHNN